MEKMTMPQNEEESGLVVESNIEVKEASFAEYALIEVKNAEGYKQAIEKGMIEENLLAGLKVTAEKLANEGKEGSEILKALEEQIRIASSF